jgi:hypothetical protein
MRDRGGNHGGLKQEICILLPITFTTHRSIDAVRVASRIFTYNGRSVGRQLGAYSWNAFEHLTPAKGETLQINIADIPYEYEHPGFYGDLKEGGAWLYPPTAHDLTIEICSGRRVQRKRLAILMLNQGVSFSEGSLNPGGRFQIRLESGDMFP